jgi:putative hemolysin
VAANPNRFLSAVQIGVTMMGFLSAAFGGATLADDIPLTAASGGRPPARRGPVSLERHRGRASAPR